MRRAVLALAACCVFWGTLIFAQTAKWKSYTTTDGLIHNTVTTFHQDRKGYLWIGTIAGVSRFDGELFENYDLEDSVASNHTISILEEDNGTLWFLTTTGLKRYDGKQFTGFTTANGLPDNMVTAIFKDRSGNIWLGTRKGISRFDGKRIQTFTEKDGMSEKEVRSIYQDRTGQIWAIFRLGGISRFTTVDRKPAWQTFTMKEGLPHHIVNDICEDNEGNLWVATYGGVAKLVEGKFLSAHFNALLPAKIIMSIHLDAEGALWFRTASEGMLKWNGQVLRQFTTEDGLASNLVTAVLKDRTGHFWLATDNGVSKYEKNGFQTFRARDGLASDFVRAVFEDREGILWFGTQQGISKYEPGQFFTFLEDEPRMLVPQNSQVREIFRDRQGNLWFPSFRGLGYYNNSEFKIFTLKDGLPDTAIHAILQDTLGNIWVGTFQGISIFDGQKFQQVKDSLIAGKPIMQMLRDKYGQVWIVRHDNVVIVHDGTKFYPFDEAGFSSKFTIEHIFKDTQEHVWFHTLGGMIRYDGTQTKYFPFEEIMPGSVLHDHLADRQGNMWFGTSKGLAKYDGKAFARFTRNEGLPGSAVRRIYQDSSGVLWLAMEERDPKKAGAWVDIGIARYDGKSFRLFTTQDGLLSNHAHGFFEEKSGGLWFLMDKGLSRYDGKGFINFSVADGLAGTHPGVMISDANKNLWIGTNGGLSKCNGRFVSSFSVQDGLIDNEILDLEVDKQNHLWIRTKKGVQRYVENKISPQIDLTGLSIGTKSYPLDRKLILAHNQNNLLIHYRGISLITGAEKLQYVYKLVGYDTTWFGPVRGKQAIYHLSPGSYTFVVKAISRDLYESEIPAEFSFTILPPFWKTWWFLTLTSVSTLLLVYTGYRRRVNAKLEKARILNELKAAHEMQMGLMPKSDPVIEGFDISGLCKPAEEVGGDYFDYVWLDEERTKLGIAIVDVSGKAMKGAMTAVMSSGMLYSEVGNSHSPRIILQKINKPMYLKTDSQIFTAMSFAVIDIKSKTLTFSSAGQSEPILKRNGEIQYLKIEGMHFPLGIRENVEYGEITVQLQSGDVVIFYTDGVPEAMNEKNVLFDFERLEAIIRNLPSLLHASEIVEKLLSEVGRFSGKARQHDDMTVVVVRVT